MSERKTPRLVRGMVQAPELPIDGRVLYVSQWAHDKSGDWHLYSWDAADDEAMMESIFLLETEAGMGLYDTLEEFREVWQRGEWEPEGSLCFAKDQITVIEEVERI